MQESRKRSLEALPLSPLPEADDATLSLEERRRRNIERNRRFMEMNFGPLLERGAATLAPQSASPPNAADQPAAGARPARDRAREQRKTLASLREKLPHRTEQLSRVWKYFLYSTSTARPALYLYGPAESGKMTTLTAVLSALGSMTVTVDCRLCPSLRDLLATLWSRLQVVTGSKESVPRTPAALALALSRFDGGRLCVVLQHFDSLPYTRELGHLLDLKASCALVDVCLLGRTAASATGTAVFAEQCVCMHFPAYTPDQQQAFLLATATEPSPPPPPSQGLSLLALAKAVVSTTAPFTHSLREAAALLRQTVAAQGSRLQAGQAFSLPEARATVLSALLARPPSSSASEAGQARRSWAAGLPRKLQCLLLAAYLATHNPQSSDNITMLGEAVRRRRQSASAGGAGSAGEDKSGEAGASLFSAERLLSIFAQVFHKLRGVAMNDYADAAGQAMLASLVRRGVLFTAPGAQFKLATPRYGCRLSHKQAEAVAQAMHFPLHDYLYNSSVSKYSFR